MSSRKTRASAHISHEENNDELIDEINSFHAKDREIKSGALYKKRKFDRPEEILNVEAEASDSSGDDDGSDFDDDDMNDITDNKWGKKRKDFYGTGFVDKDWGGMREEEMEEAELEEEDALTRQKLMDKSTAVIADLFDDDEEEEDQDDQTVQVDTTLEFNETNAKKKNKKTVKILEQYKARKRIFDLVVKPLDGIINELPEKCALRAQLVYVAQTYTAYLMNVMFLLKLRADQLNKEKLEDPLIDLHPVVEALKKLNKRIAECEDFLHTNSEKLDELKLWVEEDEREKLSELCEKIGGVLLSKKKAMNSEKSLEETSSEEKPRNFTAIDDSEEKRKASDRIAKNKEYHDKRGKKKATISKTKNRKKVRAIEKRVKSQIGNVRREMQKYSGESGGIRASTIKSTKLIA